MALKSQVHNTSLAVARYFPEGTKMTSPQGGFISWVQLHEKVDSLNIYQKAKAENISIIPGMIYGSFRKYRNYIRISCGYLWDEQLEQGIKRLGEIVREEIDCRD